MYQNLYKLFIDLFSLHILQAKSAFYFHCVKRDSTIHCQQENYIRSLKLRSIISTLHKNRCYFMFDTIIHVKISSIHGNKIWIAPGLKDFMLRFINAEYITPSDNIVGCEKFGIWHKPQWEKKSLNKTRKTGMLKSIASLIFACLELEKRWTH